MQYSLTRSKKLAAALAAAAGLSACMGPATSLELDTPACPPVSVVASGRMVNFFEVQLHIEGHQPRLLVPNIDMPGDEAIYILGLQPSAHGVEVLVSDSDYVKDVDVQVSPECRVTTVRPNNSFKPNPHQGGA